MSLDRSRILENAQKLLAKGQYDRAIAEYEKLLREDPNDVRTWLKIGDTYTRMGAIGEACQTYQRVAEHYAEQSFFLKAVAVYKQILKLDPTRVDLSLRLGEMYERLDLVGDALSTYELVIEAYQQAGDHEAALAALAKMSRIDPGNIAIRIKYGEGLSRAGRVQEAAEEFEAGANLLRNKGREDDFIKVAERLLYHRPESVQTARELAEIYLRRGDAKRALSRLQLCFKVDPQDLGTLGLLAHAFEMLGQTQKTVSVYHEMSRIHHAAGRTEERLRFLRSILELDPQDEEARRALASYARPSRPSSEVSLIPERSQSDMRISGEATDVTMPEEEPRIADFETATTSSGSGISVPPRSKPPFSSIPPEVAREAQIARLLTECDVFYRYGLRNRVLDQLRQVLEIEPSHVEARERLKDVYLQSGDKEAAVDQLYTLAELFKRDNPQVAELYVRQAVELDPTSAHNRGWDIGDGDLGETEDDVFFVDADDSTVSEAPSGAQFAPGWLSERPSSAPTRASLPSLHEFERSFDTPTEGDGDGLDPMSPQEFEAVPLRDTSEGEHTAAVERVSALPLDIEEALNEVDFFVAQGLLDEARATITDALGTHPAHPLLLDKLEELEEVYATNGVPANGLSHESDESFQLAAKLAEEIEFEDQSTGSDVLDVDAVFAQFKRGVEEQVAPEDSQTHFDLGIAYKEMGLLEDAMKEFKLSMSDPQRQCIAHTMIGLCHVEKGELHEAVSQFKLGLYAESKTDREELGLYYELGTVYALLNDAKEALYYYQKVRRQAPDFRNVSDRIDALTKTTAGTRARSDVDRAFDDLLDDDL